MIPKPYEAAPPVATETAPKAVSAADLPLHCPRPDAPLWCMHPRVYLPVEESGQVACPYCGAKYVVDG